MRETAPTAPTAETNEYDRTTAHGIAIEYRLNLDQAAQLARALAEAREAGFAAGLEERADDAHAAGYAEGLADGIDKGRRAALHPVSYGRPVL